MSPPIDLGSPSQDSTSTVHEDAARKPLGGVDFMCGLDHDSSQSSVGSTAACNRKRRPRLIITDEMLEGLVDNVCDKCESDSDSELPDIKL